MLQVAIFAEFRGGHDFAVPQRVQIAALAVQLDLEGVAAFVAAVAGVQRLVRVADEMHQELQRLRACRIGLFPVCEDAALGLDRSDHAVAVRAVFARHVAAVVFAEIDVMPARGGASQRLMVVAQVVGPVGDVAEHALVAPAIVGRTQQARDFGAGPWREFGFGQTPDQAMAIAAPGVGGRGRQCDDKRDDERG